MKRLTASDARRKPRVEMHSAVRMSMVKKEKYTDEPPRKAIPLP